VSPTWWTHDDDSGGGTDARLRFRVPATGSYYLVAQAYSEGEGGGYSLTLEVAAPARPATPQPIRVGETLSGTLTADGPILFDGNADVPYHLYILEAREGRSWWLPWTRRTSTPSWRSGPC
jgi:hypothetical protein